MSDRSDSGPNSIPLASALDGAVYLVEPRLPEAAGREVDLLELIRVLWTSKWLVIACTVFLSLAGVCYALLAPKWYRTEVVLVPVDDSPTSRLMSQFGGLASLVGVNMGGSSEAEPLAVLKSRAFIRDFIDERNLLSVLFPDRWDALHNTWIGPEERWPDLRDGVEFFGKKVLQIIQDRKTGLITISVAWRDPAVAASWANSLAEEINQRMRERAIAEAEANVRFLRQEIASTDLVALQQPIGRLLELELQKLMLARGGPQYSFRVVDVAQVPKRPESPRKKLIIAGAFFLGAALSMLFVILRHYVFRGATVPQEA